MLPPQYTPQLSPNTKLSPEHQILTNVDHVPHNIPPPGKSHLLILEDNEAVIKMCVKGRSVVLRHVQKTHRIDLDWIFERLVRDRSTKRIMMKWVSTKQQIADILTKGSFPEQTWLELLRLFQIGIIKS